MGKVKVKRFRSCRQDPLAGGSSQRTRDREGAFRVNTIPSSPTPSGAGPTEKPPAVISKVCGVCVHVTPCGRVVQIERPCSYVQYMSTLGLVQATV